MDEISWSRMDIFFPEWFLDVETGKRREGGDNDFPEIRKVEFNGLNFKFKGEWKIQLWVNQEIPVWIKKAEIDQEKLLEFYVGLCDGVYKQGLEKLYQIYPILEK